MLSGNFIDVGTKKPELDLADIFHEYFEEYRRVYGCNADEMRAVNAILKCRTAQMGGLLRVCDECGKWQFIWKACKNRNCNKCGAFEKAKWLSGLTTRLLPTHYHQVVLTIDHEINEIAYHNQKVIYDIVFKTASETLQEFGRRYLGGVIGFTGALHTWGQQVHPHIHLHCMVIGGALVETSEGYEWRGSQPTFLFPVVELSAAFRDAFCDEVLKAYEKGEIGLSGRCMNEDVAKLVERMRARKWEVYIQKPPQIEVAPNEIPPESDDGRNTILVEPDPRALQERLLDPVHLADYLGRYVHQSAISNSRLIEMADGEVTFNYYDNRDKDESGRGTLKEMSLSGVEFIRRFLWHVLPKGYVRIRHYGLHASSCRLKLMLARFLLGLPLELPPKPILDLAQWLQSLGQDDPNRCPFCQHGIMRQRATFGPLSGWRLMFLVMLGVAVQGQVATQEVHT